mgnify:CR=1 FL=1
MALAWWNQAPQTAGFAVSASWWSRRTAIGRSTSRPGRRRTQAKRGRCGRIPMDSGVATPCPWPGEIKHRRRPGRRQCLLVVPTYCHWPIPHLALVGAVHRRMGAVAGESRWTAASRPHVPGPVKSSTADGRGAVSASWWSRRTAIGQFHVSPWSAPYTGE